MRSARSIAVSKGVVGAVWLFGLAELVHPVWGIAPALLWWGAGFSLVAHALQSAYFLLKFGATARHRVWHVAQIMVFGMPHVVGYRQSVMASVPGRVRAA